MPATTLPVLVTGATGYIGAEITRQLLERGYRVRGTTRNVENAIKAGHLTGLAGAAERLELVEAEILDRDSLDRVVAGCGYALHVASPFIINVRNPQRDLIDPAVQGTLNVMQACEKDGTVRRLVLTSSIAALADGADGTRLSESSWNTTSSLVRNPYYFAKTQAERAAWVFVDEHDPAFDLIAILPALVLGPSLVPGTSQSSQNLVSLTNGDWPGITAFPWWIVDVRDVAHAHILAMENPSAAGRYIVGAGTMTMREVVDYLREDGWADKCKLPSFPLDNRFGTFLVRLAVRRQPPGTRSWLLAHVGGRFNPDTSKTRDELGVEFRDSRETLHDAMADLDRWGHLGKKVR